MKRIEILFVEGNPGASGRLAVAQVKGTQILERWKRWTRGGGTSGSCFSAMFSEPERWNWDGAIA